MKIVCEGCGAKYAVADEKVAGRTVRIRCKKCGAVLVLDAAPARGADLFAPAPADDAGDVVASRPAARAPEPAGLTGERNESSVLFSLANLRSLAAEPPATRTERRSRPGMATGEGSGLVDIRALAGALAAPRVVRGDEGAMDSLLGIGSGTVPLAGALGAPLLAPVRAQPASRGIVLGAAIGGVSVLAAAALVAVALVAHGSGAHAEVRAVRAPAAPTAAPTTLASPAPTPTAAAPSTPTPAPVLAPAAVARADAAHALPHARRPRHGEETPSPAIAAPAPTPALRAPESGAVAAVGRLFDERPRAATPAHDDTPALPPTPARDQVMAALRAAQAGVAACGQGTHGLATTQLTISGETGRVTNATVSGQLAGTPVGSCVARAARGARFPRFQQATFQVTYPFAL